MDLRAKYLIDQPKSLTEEQKKWVIPNEIFGTLENCSLQLEHLFEHRYERFKANRSSIRESVDIDPFIKEAVHKELEFLHASLWVIDHFHVGVLGFDHIFEQMARSYLYYGIDGCPFHHYFDPDTNRFDLNLNPFPPREFHYLDEAGNIISSKDEFDRSNLISMQWNFYRGLRSPRVEQRERFRALYNNLEYSDFSLEQDDPEPYAFRSWDDPENEAILANLEEVKSAGGRPKDSAQDDCYAVMYSKILLTRYFGDDPGKIPSRRSCILKVAEHLQIAEHNIEAFHKRVDRKLKRKMAFRDLGQ